MENLQAGSPLWHGVQFYGRAPGTQVADVGHSRGIILGAGPRRERVSLFKSCGILLALIARARRRGASLGHAMLRSNIAARLRRFGGHAALARGAGRNLANLTSLTGIQVANAVVPLLIVPFALHVIGATAYAELAIAESIAIMVLAIVLFSFEVDGVASVIGLDVSQHRRELSEALSGIVAARFLLYVAAASIAITIYALVTDHSVLILALWLLVPFGQVFHCYWFYQGIENNAPPAVITISCRLLSAGVVFASVHNVSDSYLIPLGIGGPFALGGVISLTYICRRFGLRLHWVGFRRIWRLLNDGKEIFVGTAAVAMYREVNIMLLGIASVAAPAIAGYALVEKTVKFIQAVTRPLNQFFFPKVLRAIQGQSAPTRSVAKTILRFTLPQIGVVLLILIMVPLMVLATIAFFPNLGKLGNLPNVPLLFAIMAPAPLFGLGNFMFGTAGLNYLGERRYQSRVIVTTGMLNVGMCLLLASFLGAVGAAICFVGAELLLLIMVLIRYLRQRCPAEDDEMLRTVGGAADAGR